MASYTLEPNSYLHDSNTDATGVVPLMRCILNTGNGYTLAQLQRNSTIVFAVQHTEIYFKRCTIKQTVYLSVNGQASIRRSIKTLKLLTGCTIFAVPLKMCVYPYRLYKFKPAGNKVEAHCKLFFRRKVLGKN